MTFTSSLVEYAARHDENLGRVIPCYRLHVLGEWEKIMEWAYENLPERKWCWNHVRGIHEFEIGVTTESDMALVRLSWPEW